MGDYWHFTISLPQIFGASNIYVNSQLSARNGEIEGYDFIKFNTSYDKVTEAYSSKACISQIDLSFYTRREAMAGIAASRIITIHYQSDGTSLSGIQSFPLIGTEEEINACNQNSVSLLLLALILSAMVVAALIVLAALKRTAKSVPEILMSVGVLLIFLSGYVFSSGTSVPLFWSALYNSSSLLLLGAAILSTGENLKKMCSNT